MKIKICGITRQEDALLAQDAGAWAVGFIFANETPRYVTPEKATKIAALLSPEINKVGVFVNSNIEEVANIAEQVGLTKIQLHGDETPDFCRKVAIKTGKEVVKAVKVKDESSLNIINDYKEAVSFILLDTYSDKADGGTGKTFNWDIAKQAKKYGVPIILAGGLNPDNIVQAYGAVQPYALDLSSGLEAEKGIKDADKINRIKTILR